MRSVIVPLALVVAFSASFLAQDAPPKEPFKAVHLINITSPADTAELLATLTDLNAAVAKAGTMQSSSGSPIAAPSPRNTCRRGIDVLVTNIMIRPILLKEP